VSRPQTATDEDILRAARKVLDRKGPDAFSIAEVAIEIGLTRGAITQRFKGTHALKVALLTRQIEQFTEAIGMLPKPPCGDSLLRIAAFIGSHPKSRKSNARFFASYTSNLQDRELIALEIRRGDVLRAAISAAMPPVRISHGAAVNAFLAHISGVAMAWVASQENLAPQKFFVTRTAEWLELADIPFDTATVDELLAPTLKSDGKAKTAVRKSVKGAALPAAKNTRRK
jgi:TetR/AcrR family macrolide resistance operon transcriptional repressor